MYIVTIQNVEVVPIIHNIMQHDNDENTGWAVAIHNEKERKSSTQRVLTTCQLYRSYTTDEALAQAAESYGNVESPGRLTPNAYRRKEV